MTSVQTMSKGHGNRMAAIETAVLQISLDWDTGVPEHLQSLKSSVVALEESVARQQVRLAESSPAAEVWERAAIELCSWSPIVLVKGSERRKHLEFRHKSRSSECHSGYRLRWTLRKRFS